MASLSERVGTDAEHSGDRQKISTLWKYSPSSYQNEMIVELPYTHYISPTVSPSGYATVVTLNQYKINSIYDPDLTGAGTQPLGRDTWSAIYNYYKVLESDVKYEVIDMTYRTPAVAPADANQPSLLGWMADITATPPTGPDQWFNTAQGPNHNKQQIFSEVDIVDPIAGRPQKRHRGHYHWNSEDFDTSIIDTAGKNTWTAVGSDPANLNYFSVLCCNPEQIAGGNSRRFALRVTIKYLVAFKQINRALLHTIN